MKNFILIFLFILMSIHLYPCTSFVIKSDDELVFGRNLDWFTDVGLIVVNQRNISKTALVFPPDKPAKWTSKYGSVTFNQYGKEFPYGGINEKGLVVEVLVANAKYPNFDERSAINELQWVQYQLDNFSTVEEVINSDKILRISKISQELHFFVCDSNGNRAVIEYHNKKMLVYKDKDLPISVLENDNYSQSIRNYNNEEDCRFLTTSNMIDNYPKNKKNIVDYSFNILNKVKLNMDGLWSIVYDIKNMSISFNSSSNRKIKQINILDFDFSTNKSLILNINSNKKGNINKYFKIFDLKTNTKIMRKAFLDNEIYLPEEILDKFYNYGVRLE